MTKYLLKGCFNKLKGDLQFESFPNQLFLTNWQILRKKYVWKYITARPWFSRRSRAAHRTLHFSLIFVGLEWVKQIEFYWLLSGIFYSPFIGYATARFDLSDYKQLVVGESKSDSLGTGFVHLETKKALAKDQLGSRILFHNIARALTLSNSYWAIMWKFLYT